MFTHQIVTTCTARRGLLRRRTAETTIVTEVQADSAEELGRITRAVLTAVDDALPDAYVTSQPQPIPPVDEGTPKK